MIQYMTRHLLLQMSGDFRASWLLWVGTPDEANWTRAVWANANRMEGG